MFAFLAVVADAVATGSGCGGSCDDIGCSDQAVFIDAGELPTNLLPFDVRTCINGLCEDTPYIVTEQVSPTVRVLLEVPTSGVEEGDEVSVTLAVSSHATHELLLEASGSGKAIRFRAAGDCGPWCTNASLALDPASGLLVDRVATD